MFQVAGLGIDKAQSHFRKRTSGPFAKQPTGRTGEHRNTPNHNTSTPTLTPTHVLPPSPGTLDSNPSWPRTWQGTLATYYLHMYHVVSPTDCPGASPSARSSLIRATSLRISFLACLIFRPPQLFHFTNCISQDNRPDIAPATPICRRK